MDFNIDDSSHNNQFLDNIDQNISEECIISAIDENAILQIPNDQQQQKQQHPISPKNAEKKKKPKSDYRKNICGYITKKIVREFIGEAFAETVKEICGKYQTDYKKVKNMYLNKIERVTGPSHIPDLIQADHQDQIPMKLVFREFFEWFLKQRYVRYLIHDGKMDEKQEYIRYKNQALYHLFKTTPQTSIKRKPTKNQGGEQTKKKK